MTKVLSYIFGAIVAILLATSVLALEANKGTDVSKAHASDKAKERANENAAFNRGCIPVILDSAGARAVGTGALFLDKAISLDVELGKIYKDEPAAYVRYTITSPEAYAGETGLYAIRWVQIDSKAVYVTEIGASWGRPADLLREDRTVKTSGTATFYASLADACA